MPPPSPPKPSEAAPSQAKAPVARFEIARFGAALLHGAEEESADAQAATYKVHARFSALADFYRAIYGQQKGMVVDVVDESEMICVAVGADVVDADFSTLMVTPHPAGEPNRFRVMVMPRDEPSEDDEPYPDSSPWSDPD